MCYFLFVCVYGCISQCGIIEDLSANEAINEDNQSKTDQNMKITGFINVISASEPNE